MNSWKDDYVPKDFILHLAGKSNKERFEMFKLIENNAQKI